MDITNEPIASPSTLQREILSQSSSSSLSSPIYNHHHYEDNGHDDDATTYYEESNSGKFFQKSLIHNLWRILQSYS